MLRQIFAGAFVGLVGLPAAVMAQTACEPYTVQGGDTLRGIAQSAYGNGNFQIIFDANRTVIGNNPNNIEIGDELLLPCEDGTLPGAVVEVAEAPQPTAAALEASGQPIPQGYVPQIKFLTGGNYPPFTDESMPGRGMFTELVDTAMTRGGQGRDYGITFVNDWGSHLSALLPINAFDLGFPWFKPDCAKLDLLSPSMAQRCTDYIFSDPFYELVVTGYVLPDSPYANAATPDDLFGARVCRPDGFYTFDLEEAGLVEPNITLVQPVLPRECFEQMLAGTVDYIPMEVQVAESAISELNIRNQVLELSQFSRLVTAHVLSHKSNPYGRVYITLLNQGLAEMRQSGEWFGLVSTQLAAYARANQ